MGASESQTLQPSQPSKPSSLSKSSKKQDKFEYDIQQLCNKGLLPPMAVPNTWTVYLHKKSVLNGEIPHERLILEFDKFILSVELSNTEGGSSGIIGADWRVWATIINEQQDKTRNEWRKHDTANFALQHLVFYVKNIMNKTGAYNVLTQNCQTFARKLAGELGKPVTDLNDGTKAIIGFAAVVSGALIASALSGSRQDEDSDD